MVKHIHSSVNKYNNNFKNNSGGLLPLWMKGATVHGGRRRGELGQKWPYTETYKCSRLHMHTGKQASSHSQLNHLVHNPELENCSPMRLVSKFSSWVIYSQSFPPPSPHAPSVRGRELSQGEHRVGADPSPQIQRQGEEWTG